ncbi:unnamed protein product [Mytilus coruscus]|uniref:PiggyBac transposable element-derived protein domain-containing protein n=1 Tax=Mytilus coruscus TaxID=42192 RepID=A0A6J8F595_MYTCO|nr:unnamed protein product [Mytilus coruscus]
MSDSSDDNFQGFSAHEIELASERYRQTLALNGIGDDIEISDVESELSDENNEDPIFLIGLPHLFTLRNNTGSQTVLGIEKDPVDFFQLSLGDNLIQNIIDKTESYANKQIRDHPDQNKSVWSCPTIVEMKAFFGLTFLMGIEVKPDIKSYWSTDCLETPYFATVMTRDRFQQIMRYLPFPDSNNNIPQLGDPNHDCLYKVRYFMNALNEQMRNQYVPKRQVCVDESMILFKGKVNFKQYMSAKPSKWGIKLWALAESDSGYMSFCEIYSGKKDRPVQGLACSVVKSCVEGAGLVDHGYHIYMDNFFTSPALFVDLFHNFNTGACGTVRKNRKGLPKELMIKKPTGVNERGQSQFRQKETIAATIWKDKKLSQSYLLSMTTQ